MNHLIPSVSRVETKWRAIPVDMKSARQILYTVYQVEVTPWLSHSLLWNSETSESTSQNLSSNDRVIQRAEFSNMRERGDLVYPTHVVSQSD